MVSADELFLIRRDLVKSMRRLLLCDTYLVDSVLGAYLVKAACVNAPRIRPLTNSITTMIFGTLATKSLMCLVDFELSRCSRRVFLTPIFLS